MTVEAKVYEWDRENSPSNKSVDTTDFVKLIYVIDYRNFSKEI